MKRRTHWLFALAFPVCAGLPGLVLAWAFLYFQMGRWDLVGEITGIFCADGDRTLGSYVACQANNRQDVLIAGYDATAEQLEVMLNDGPECNLICSTALYPDRIGALAIETAYDILQGEEVEPIQYSEIGLLTAEDAESWGG